MCGIRHEECVVWGVRNKGEMSGWSVVVSGGVRERKVMFWCYRGNGAESPPLPLPLPSPLLLLLLLYISLYSL